MRDLEPDDTVQFATETGMGALRYIPLVLALLGIVVRWVVLRNTHSTTEDFLITLRYAENLAAGRGFVYNPGEAVLGTTTPLYALILAAAVLLGLDPTLIGKSLNILAAGVTVWLICRLARALGHERAGWVAALMFALTSAPISVSIGGMETSLVTCTGLAAICAFVEKRPTLFAVASAALFLLRIDGLLLTAILAGAWLLRQRTGALRADERLSLRTLALFAMPVLTWALFATWYFGSPVPASMLAKLAVYARTRPGTLPNLGDFRTQFFSGPVQILLFGFFLVGAANGLWKHVSLRPALLWVAAYYGAMLVSRVPAFGWYFLPPLPIYYLCVGLGLAVIIRPVPALRSGRAALAGLVLLSLPLLWNLRSVQRSISHAQRLEDEVRRPLGEWLGSVAAPNDTVMLEPIGYIGYYSHLRVLDVIGLVSPEVLPYYRAEIPNPLVCIVDRHRPEWLVLRPDERESLAPDAGPPSQGGSTLLNGEYRWVRSMPDGAASPAFEVYHRAR